MVSIFSLMQMCVIFLLLVNHCKLDNVLGDCIYSLQIHIVAFPVVHFLILLLHISFLLHTFGADSTDLMQARMEHLIEDNLGTKVTWQ